jgi:hypothetical protein
MFESPDKLALGLITGVAFGFLLQRAVLPSIRRLWVSFF